MAKTEPQEVLTDEGTSPLVRALPEFDVLTYEGNEEISTHYTMRPLGLRDAFKMLRIISAASTSMARMAQQGAFKDAQGVMYAILGSIPYAEREVKELLSNVITTQIKGVPISVTVDEFDAMPLDSLVTIVEAIASHPDLKSFLKNVRGLANSQAMTQIRQEMEAAVPQPTTN